MPLNFKAHYLCPKDPTSPQMDSQLTESQINLAWVHTYG